MAVPGIHYGSFFGPPILTDAIAAAGGATTFDAKAVGATWAARFTATQALPVLSVKINCSAVTMGTWVGSVSIDAIDATTGKPPAASTPYDVNATIAAVTFVTGWQTITFAVAPTTNLTVGAEYAIVIRTTTAATALTLRSYQTSSSRYPTIILTSADSGTSWAEIAASTPIASLLLTGGVEDPMGMCPYATITTNSLVTTSGNLTATALKFVVPSGISIVVAAIDCMLTKNGTPPAGSNPRIRIFDSSDVLVANSTITIDMDSLTTGATNRKMYAPFTQLITLGAGTYRVVFDCASSTATANSWQIKGAIVNVAGNAPSRFNCSTCPNVATPVWTDTTDQLPVRLYVDSIAGTAAAPYAGIIGG